MLNQIHNHIIQETSLGILYPILALLFSVLYFGVGFLFVWFSKILIQKKYASKISTVQLFENQISFEIKHGIIAILIFAGYGILIIWFVRDDVLQIKHTGSIMILIDLLILAIWNEIHFYVIHRLMHTKLFLPFHRVHHKSVVVTPFSAYSFHPIESFLNGSVMIIPMFFHEFELMALLLLPVYSIILNMAGHSNVRLDAIAKLKTALHMSSRHNAHHTKFNLNFGFASPMMDFLFSAKKKLDPVEKKTDSKIKI